MSNTYILLITVIIVFIFFIFKRTKYSNKSLKILEENFPSTNLKEIQSIEDLKIKLEIKNNSYSKTIENTILDAKHKIEIFRSYRERNRLAFNEFSFFKVTANCVIDSAMKKELNLKESIKLLYLILESPKLEEVIGNDANKEFLLENFFNLLEGFVKRYQNKIKELK